MTRYLIMWESRTQLDSSENSARMIKQAIADTKDSMKKGTTESWGAFATGGRGYAVINVNNEFELYKLLLNFRKYNIWTTSAEPILSLDEVEKMLPG